MLSRFLLISFCSLFWINSNLKANNVQLSNLQIIDNRHISVSVSWDNAWNLSNGNTRANYDAVWVFLKYKYNGGQWQHLKLADLDSLHQSNSYMIEIKSVTDSGGVFVKLKQPTETNVSDETIILCTANLLALGNYDLKAFGIEMVYLPEADFWVGDGQSNHSLKDSISGAPILIDASTTALGTNANQLSTGFSNAVSQIPATFPKGQKAFYGMKYELSQQQYAEFLNTLTVEQQTTRTVLPPTSIAGKFVMVSTGQYANRNGVVIKTPSDGNSPAIYGCNANVGNEIDAADDGQNRAMNFISWADVVAYLDWVALRPLSEMEYEKSCRGEKSPVKLAFAWDTPYSVDANTGINEGTEDETVSESTIDSAGLTNQGYSGFQGPLRNGFGANQTNDRLQAGAGYYGMLELSGNLWEVCIALNDAGLSFASKAGNGSIGSDGNADEPNWYPNADNAIYRGGAWLSGVTGTFRDLAISDRFYMNLRPTLRRNTSGGRGGRSE